MRAPLVGLLVWSCVANGAVSTAGDDAPCRTPDADRLDFGRATMLYNNLGGHGPRAGPQLMRYGGVGKAGNGRPIDLIVTNTTPYFPTDSASNGRQGSFGRINVAPSASVGLKFSFVDGVTNVSVALKEFTISFLDFDMSTSTSGKECLTIAASQWSSYLVSDRFTKSSSWATSSPRNRHQRSW